jgi:hypothetical protein
VRLQGLENQGVIAMSSHSRAFIFVAVAGWLSAPVLALAQTAQTTPPHVPLQKTIGQAGPGLVPSLIVMNSRGASLQGGKLTLTGVAPNSIVFADRPVRAAGHALTTQLIEEWAQGGGTFASDPPNATVSVFSKDGAGVRDAVVVLKAPKVEGDRLTFDVDVLEGDLAGGDGPASVFIDRFGFGGFHGGGFGGGFHGGGFGGGFDRGGFNRVGVANVNVNRVGVVGGRGAWYRGAPVAAAAVGGAAVGAAAVGAAAYGAYPYYAAPPACGYYPYPPCY